MKLASTLILTSLVFGNANDTQESHRRALHAIRSKYLQQIGRDLASPECEASQIQIEESGVNESFAAIGGDEEELPLYCDILMTEGGISQYCDFADSDISVNSVDCRALGGSVTTLSLETTCNDGLMTMTLESLNLCISDQCTQTDFEEELEMGLNEAFKEEEGLTCGSDVQFNPYLIRSGSISPNNVFFASGLGFLVANLV